MDHGEYIRDVEGSAVAVLMIHGIAGTPAHFRDLLPVIPENWTVHNILLDGHGKKVEDFGKTSMKKWKAQANAAVTELLSGHDKLLIVAHSMGTLFAIQAAIDHPDRIPALFLLAAPMRPWVRFSTMLTCLRVSRGDIREDDAPAHAMKNATCIQLDRRLWKYISWMPRMIELLVEIRRVRKLLPPADSAYPHLSVEGGRTGVRPVLPGPGKAQHHSHHPTVQLRSFRLRRRGHKAAANPACSADRYIIIAVGTKERSATSFTILVK